MLPHHLHCWRLLHLEEPPGVTSGFLAAEHGGTWGDAAQVPGLARLNTGGYALVNGVSCAPHGYCAAIGEYASGSNLEDRMFETIRSG